LTKVIRDVIRAEVRWKVSVKIENWYLKHLYFIIPVVDIAHVTLKVG
jgi:hypothetical protein